MLTKIVIRPYARVPSVVVNHISHKSTFSTFSCVLRDNRLILDEAIRATVVREKPANGKGLGPTVFLSEVLELARQKFSHVQLLAPGTSPESPGIVRILTKEELEIERNRLKENEKKATKKERQVQSAKQIQITCGIGAADLARKIGQAKMVLVSGTSHVHVVIGKRKGRGSPMATVNELAKLESSVITALDQVGAEIGQRVRQNGLVIVHFKPNPDK